MQPSVKISFAELLQEMGQVIFLHNLICSHWDSVRSYVNASLIQLTLSVQGKPSLHEHIGFTDSSHAEDFFDVFVHWPTTIVEKFVPRHQFQRPTKYLALRRFFLNAPDQLASTGFLPRSSPQRFLSPVSARRTCLRLQGAGCFLH